MGYTHSVITAIFPKLREYAWIGALTEFFRSNAYLIILAVLTACAGLFGWELAVYYCFLLLGVAALLFGEDTSPIVPIVLLAYVTVSPQNNPAVYPTSSVFYSPAFRTQFIAILAVAVVFLVARLVYSLCTQPRLKGMPALTIGFLLLGLSYVLGGAFSGEYGGRTAFFGFAEICALCVFYFYFYYTIAWDRAAKDLIFRSMLALGCVVALEAVGMYFHAGISSGETVDRGLLITGWGMYNNVGGVLSMCLPAPFYFAVTRRRGCLFTLWGIALFGGVVLTQSRGALLFGGIVFAACLIFTLVRCQPAERRGHWAVCGVAFALCLAGALICWEQLRNLFSSMIRFDDNGRFEIYSKGWEQFLSHPFFGVGFYKCDAFRWGNLPSDAFLPPRYHNTYVQLLASGGLFAFLMYLLHRAQTLIVFFRQPSLFKLFCFFIVLALILTSILDCHFFNFGPGLIYSIVLVYAERADRAQPAQAPPAEQQ